MAKFYDGITDDLAEFIKAQPIFFVATAPETGRINISPKGGEHTLRVLGANSVAFLNLTGSGNETAAHLRGDPRITLMFCSFDRNPKILRLYGSAKALHPRDTDWDKFKDLFPDHPGKRQIVVVEVDSAMTSCGFGVPLMELTDHRDTLNQWAERKGEDGIREYWRDRNSVSFDGLPTGIFGEK